MISCLLLLFFLSGMCGLIYQIIWSRILALLFGHTTFAIGTVITAFMGGLALGSFYFGRWADRESQTKNILARYGQSPLLLAYGIMESAIGIYALFTPLLFKGAEMIYLQFSTLSFYPLSSLRFILCSLILIVPTFLMGGTLPLLSKFLIHNFSDISSKLGQLYFINTIGATVGTFIAGFFLIDSIGISKAMQLAAFTNICIGIAVYIMNRERGAVSHDRAASPDTVSDSPEILESVALSNGCMSHNTAKLLFVLFAFTGFASMIYEICWTRALALALGSSTYAFSTMLTTFLLGIAIGSALFSRLARKQTFTLASLGRLELLIAFFCLLAVPLLGTIPLYFIQIFPFVKQSYNLILITNFVLSALVMIIPATLMGFAFPLVGRLYTRSWHNLGRSVGDIYSINTLGCIAGAFLTSFVLIPFLGVQNSLKIGILINGLAGLLILLNFYGKPAFSFVSLSSIAAGVLIVYFMPAWNIGIMSSGSAVYAENYILSGMDFDVAKKDTLFYRDGISSTVSVHQKNDILSLKVNGKVDASTGTDIPTQILIGYIPIFYHDNPKDVFVVGLGSGMTAKAVLDFPQVRSVICAELEPAVVEANHFFFKYNNQILHNPRFKVKIDDGRNALLASPAKYDMILSEPSNPWIAGVSSLFTEEFYRISKSRLKAGGIFCQWFHLYKMQPSDVKMVLRTFFSVFPHGNIWQANGVDLMLLGSDNELSFRYDRLMEAFLNNKEFQKTMKSIGNKTPDVFFANYITEAAALKPLFNTALLNTDDLPLLEFSAPRNLYYDASLYNLDGLYAYKTKPIPTIQEGHDKPRLSPDFFVAMINRTGGKSVIANQTLRLALAAYPKDPDLRMLKARNLLSARKQIQAEQVLRGIVSENPSHFQGHYSLGQLYDNQGLLEKAETLYDKAAALRSDHEIMNRERIANLINQEKYAKALSIIIEIRRKLPPSIYNDYLFGLINMKAKNFSSALAVLEPSLKNHPDHYEIKKCLFNIYKEQRSFMKTIETGTSLYEQKQDDLEVILGLGEAFILTGQKAKASEILKNALERDPFNREIIAQLTQAEEPLSAP